MYEMCNKLSLTEEINTLSELRTSLDSYLTAKIVDTKESLKANFLTWLYNIGNYESRIVKYERTTIRENSKKTNRESCE